MNEDNICVATRISFKKPGVAERPDGLLAFVLGVVGRGSLKGRNIEIEARPVPRLKPWTVVCISAVNRIFSQQQRCVQIQDGTPADAHGKAVGTPHGDTRFHHAAEHHLKTGGLRYGCHENPLQQPAFCDFDVDVVCRPVTDDSLEVAQ